MSNDVQPTISFKNVSKKFTYSHEQPQSIQETLISAFGRRQRHPKRNLWAVNDLSFDLYPGQSLGIIGRNGSGKSTVLKMIARIIRPTSGQVAVRGRVSALLELGAGFSFIARQKRIQVDNDDYYIDLLFFNRKLKRLLVIELKLGDFKPADKGQMELYLRWLDKYERQEGELPPIGLVLCAGKKRETVELLALENSGIRVAEYMTELPSRKVLEQKLHAAIVQAKKTFENRLELIAGKEDDEPTH